jgi:hypothetical protein
VLAAARISSADLAATPLSPDPPPPTWLAPDPQPTISRVSAFCANRARHENVSACSARPVHRGPASMRRKAPRRGRPQHHVRVEQRDKRVEGAAARGGEEGIDNFAPAGQIGVGARPPCTGGVPRLASCRAAVEVRSTIWAISSKGTATCRAARTRAARWATACRAPRAPRAARVRVGQERLLLGVGPVVAADKRARARPAAPRAATCVSAACRGTPVRRPWSVIRPGSPRRRCRSG